MAKIRIIPKHKDLITDLGCNCPQTLMISTVTPVYKVVTKPVEQISTDDNNRTTVGDDEKIYTPEVTTDFEAYYELARG